MSEEYVIVEKELYQDIGREVLENVPEMTNVALPPRPPSTAVAITDSETRQEKVVKNHHHHHQRKSPGPLLSSSAEITHENSNNHDRVVVQPDYPHHGLNNGNDNDGGRGASENQRLEELLGICYKR
jgi:hypothetical protein